MTSVPNLHQLSSGSKLLLALLLGVMLSCTPQKGLQDGADSTPTGNKVYNPKTGEYEYVEDATTLVDTINWTPKEDVAPAIGTAPVAPTGKKDSYNVSFLMPFSAAGKTLGNRIDPKTSRFLNYYGGVKLALKDLASEGVVINAKVMDTEEDPEKIGGMLEELKSSDVIVGPYNRGCLQTAAAFASYQKIPVVSPWTPAIDPQDESNYFVQVVPGLESHAAAAMQFAATHYDSAKFFLVANPKTQGHSRMQVYKDAFSTYLPEKGELELLVVDDIAMQPDSNDLTTVYHPDVRNVFFMPYYLRSEQEFVNSFMRKIHAEHGEVEVTVMGLPQWMQYQNVNPDYLEGLNTHITAVQFVDRSRPEVKAFNERYFETYKGVPEPAAWRGYALTMYLGRNLYEHGVSFLDESTNEADLFYRLRPVLNPEMPSEANANVRYIGNKGIAMLVFANQEFQRIE